MNEKERMQIAGEAMRNAAVSAAEAMAAFANCMRRMGIYAAPTIVDGKIVEVSLVREHADSHVPPVEPTN